MLQYICFYGVEGVGGVAEAARSKFGFDPLQERIALRFVCKFDRHTANIVGR